MADYLIIGAGIVGLAVAGELKRREPGAKVMVLEKEPRPGLHSSGRNSGVLHSGIYYPAGSLKARLCSAGALEMAEYCRSRGLPMSRPGKVLVPTRAADSAQLDLLAGRAAANGVEAEPLDEAALARLEPEVRSATGRALLVPSTAVVSPAEVMASLAREALAAGIELRCGGSLGAVDARRRRLEWAGETLAYGHAVNAAGLHADRVAHLFGAGRRYTLLPFKGLYWKLDPASGIRLNHLVYPVPDLRVPFLGVHTTTAIDGTIYLGPTAVPALGRENYSGLRGVTPGELLRIAVLLGGCFLAGRDGFRRLAWREGRRYSKRRFAAAARALLPRLRACHLLACDKVGIRAQMLDLEDGRLVGDFLVESGPHSTHVLNAVSPAFTSAFPLARFVCDNHILTMKDENAT
ncbi:MAG TPA: L-2-hydroxyglutarate oxidase [Allosphingosinicella sp.]|nr:L-2-hydroxyglutarate oxidase [Allosphingosinicella sp.]